ncbi:MAG: tetratricopeptide repeat protein [Deltaproteobacteria bacterium]|nr:tetratricopeptide repeat protein [Deltaproteobacteria bacterium]
MNRPRTKKIWLGIAGSLVMVSCSVMPDPNANMWRQGKDSRPKPAEVGPAASTGPAYSAKNEPSSGGGAEPMRTNSTRKESFSDGAIGGGQTREAALGGAGGNQEAGPNNSRGDQQGLDQKVARLESDLAKEREKQRRFQEMMTTNFDLLEQSVASSLSARMAAEGQPKANPSAAHPLPPPMAKPAGMQTGASRHPGAKALPKAHKASNPGLAVMPKGGESDEIVMADQDLLPPANPARLTDDMRAKPLYEKGFAYFARKDYPEAVKVFEAFLQKYPANKYSDNAQFWVGESNYQMKRYDQAEAAYRKVLRNFDHRNTIEGYKTPDAIYRLGILRLAKNKSRMAEYYFNEVLARFPNSTAAEKSQRELDALKFGTADEQGYSIPKT